MDLPMDTGLPPSAQPDVDRYAEAHPQIARSARLSPELLDGLDLAVPGPVVDVGCGEGLTLLALRDRGVEPSRLLGVDRSTVRLAATAALGFEVALGDGAAIPVPDGHASLTISRHVVEHVPDDAGFVAELARITAPGGLVYLETPRRLRGAWYVYRSPVDNRRVLDPTHLREYSSTAEVLGLVRRAGLDLVSSSEAPVTFPVGELLWRLLGRNRRADSALGRRLTGLRLTVRVPRYREIRLLARKPLTASPS